MTSDNKTDISQFAESIAEAEDIINEIGNGLLALGKSEGESDIDVNAINSTFRAAHTLKGMSAMIGLKDIADLSHALEDKLDNLRLGRTRLDNDAMVAMISTHELLSKMLAKRGAGDFKEESEALKIALKRVVAPEAVQLSTDIDDSLLAMLSEYEAHRLRQSVAAGKNIFIVGLKFPITSFDKDFTVATNSLNDLSEQIATLPSNSTTSEALFFDVLVATKKAREDLIGVLEEYMLAGIRDVTPRPAKRGAELSLSVNEGREGSKDGRRDVAARQSFSTLRRVGDIVRVNIGKLDGIMSIIGELAILKSNVDFIASSFKSNRELVAHAIELNSIAKNMDRKISELRQSVLSVRMVRIGTLFERFGTVVDKLARDSGKMLKFEMIGADTEVDKIVIEELADPLMHLVRNAADHAIESPEARMSLSKPAEGLVMVSAYQKGNHVVVEVRDDGAGMDAEAIKAKAISSGLYPKAYVDSLSRHEALEIVFAPGFSMRDSVSETSGRGVGLDVVKENIMRLGGAVAIDTRKGLGTTFTLTVPATLAVVQALIIEDCGVRYAVALNSVTEIMHLVPEKLKEAEITGIFDYNGKALPSVRLTDFFGKKVPLANTGGMKYGIIAGIAPHMLCIVVDRLVEEMDVVIKPLSPLIKTDGIAGATDMGEYGVMLIIDANGILESVNSERKFSRI